MKKLIAASVFSLLAWSATAQNKAIMLKDAGTLDKAKAEIDNNITDAKLSGRAKTWYTRGQIYEAIATDQTGTYAKLDSNAALTAYESYKKALEVEANGGKMNKEITEALKGQRLYAALMTQGAAKYQNKNYADAIKMMQLAGEVMPKDTTAPLYTAISAQQAQNNNLAKDQFERYIANGGKDASVYYSLANLYRNDKDIDKAIATLDRGLQTLPGNKDLSAERINVLMASNRLDEAVAGMKKLVDSEPNNVQNVVNLAILYDNAANKMTQDIQKATTDAKKGSSTAKQLTDAKGLLDTYNSEALRLTNAIKKQPKNTELKRQLNDLQKKVAEQKSTVAQLEADAKAAAANASAAADAEKQLAELKQKQTEQRNLAKDYYTKALAIDPNNFDANVGIGIMHFNEAVELKHVVDNMSMAEYQKNGKAVEGRVCGKFKQALPYFEKAKAVRNNDEDLNNNITTLQNVLKQFEGNKVVCVDAN